MESHPYAKTGEGGAPSTNQCSYINSKGGRCRLFATDDSGLCPHHARQKIAAQRRQNQAVVKSLLSDLDDFTTPDRVLNFLGKLLREVAAKRVDRRDAATMTYICQLMLNTQAAFDRFADADVEAQGAEAFLRFAKSQAASAPSDPDRN